MFQEKLNNLINENFSSLFFIEKNNDNEFIFYTPQFLNDGSFIYFYIQKKDKSVIFSNDMYKYIEQNIKKFQKNKNIIKDYFLNKKTFEKIVKNLEKENIKYSLLMEKEVEENNDLKEEIAKYLFTISKYYNYIYDYCLIYSKDKEAKEKEFKIAIDNFVKNFNNLNEKKIIKLEEKLYSNIDYYEYDNLDIFTGVYTELDLHKAFGELERKVEVEEKKALILVDKNQTSLVKYIEEKFLKIYSQKNVKIIYSDDYTKVSKNIEDFIKKNEKEKGNEI